MKALLTAAAILIATSASAQVANTPTAAAALPGLGIELSREMVGGTMALYAPLHAQENTDGLSILTDQSYGDDPRNVLDLYAPAGADGRLPIMVFVHGGGFVRGDKKDVANIGAHFAKHGVVTAMMNYRFAPENTWPSGAEDIAGVLAWIKSNGAAMGGDPTKIIIAGNSAGAMHAADYAFHEELQLADDGVIGAILISTPTVDLEAREVDPKRDALYYGADGDRAAQSVVNALDGRKLPVLVAYAQNEPAVIIDQVRLLIAGLAARDGRLPLISAAAGHNHISIVEHIGTADETLAPDMLEFIQLVSAQ
ncbi:MAG: acetyl esterase/lipase [Halocynthiibacter sp.]|jgi:acetyl esterase/lipase